MWQERSFAECRLPLYTLWYTANLDAYCVLELFQCCVIKLCNVDMLALSTSLAGHRSQWCRYRLSQFARMQQRVRLAVNSGCVYQVSPAVGFGPRRGPRLSHLTSPGASIYLLARIPFPCCLKEWRPIKAGSGSKPRPRRQTAWSHAIMICKAEFADAWTAETFKSAKA